MKYLLILLVLALASCVPTSTDITEPLPNESPPEVKDIEQPELPDDLPPEEEIEEIPPGDEEILPAPSNEFLGQKDSLGILTDVRCDTEEKILQFTLKNPSSLTWQLDQEIPWPTPKGMSQVSLVMNSVEMNKIRPVNFNEQEMFGPGKKFSDNCEGDAILEPGESTTCVTYPVPFKSANSFDAGTNELRVKAAQVSTQLTLTCI